jgi:hypothetical protein
VLELKNIYRADEIKFIDYFRSKRQGLLEDFKRNNPEWFDIKDEIKYETELSSDTSKVYDEMTAHAAKVRSELTPAKTDWNVVGIKRLFHCDLFEERRERYPTAFEMMDYFGDNCTASLYSTFEPQTILGRHTGGENRKGLNIRFHIPLVIPEGDVGFEVGCEIIRWDDVFGFNNQITHSGWNLTDERRLIFIVDLKRSHCDVPKAPDWYLGTNDHIPPFPKTQREGEIWQNIAKNKSA